MCRAYRQCNQQFIHVAEADIEVDDLDSLKQHALKIEAPFLPTHAETT